MIFPMDLLSHFAGFSRQTPRFFAELKRNNNRPWFTKHKQEYLTQVLEPARAFVIDMGQELGKMVPGIVADPAASIFRIHKDTRFAKDKSPYKTHLGIFFWEAGGKKLDRPGFYFELDDAGLRLYYGWYLFPAGVMERYRQAVIDEKRGPKLLGIVKKLEKSGLQVGGLHYKRLPRGLEVSPDRADLLRHNTLYTQIDCGKPAELYSPKLIKYCARQWKHSLPIHEWVQQIL